MERFVERFEIGPEENTLKPLESRDDLSPPFIGCFAYISELRALFYRWDDVLRYKLGDGSPFTLSGSKAR
jgi:hypothetical protein